MTYGDEKLTQQLTQPGPEAPDSEGPWGKEKRAERAASPARVCLGRAAPQAGLESEICRVGR